MKTKGSITIKNKRFPYSLSQNKDGSIRFVSKDAKINQDFLPEDISLLILDLPNLIIAEQKYKDNKDTTVKFRVSTKDKERIEKKAIAKGYTSVSKYLKDLALS